MQIPQIDEYTMSIILFVIIQTINVILSTIKSILTVNGSRWSAAWINAVSYTFGAVITKLITNQSFEIIIISTMLTNLFGVYIAKLLIDKTKKERLWTITATLRGDNKDTVEESLKKRGIQYTLLPAANDRYLVSIFSYSKGESSMVREILDDSNTRFTITENISSF